jgi:hypothetical protein
MTGIEGIIVAAIAAVGGVVTALVQKTRKENKEDHMVVADLVSGVKDELFNIHHKIDKVDDRMQDHIMWHYEKSDPKKTTTVAKKK